MPKIVDHEHRREEIAALTVEVIRRGGLENATLREIAQQGGLSMGVLTHYFRSKDELVGMAFHWLAQKSFRELDAVVATEAAGLARLEAALEYMFPKPNRPAHFALWMTLWDRAIRNPRLAREHRRYYERWRRYIRRFLTEARALGEIPRDLAIRSVTDLIVAAVDGLWIDSVMEPRRFSMSRRHNLVRELIRALAPRITGKRSDPTAAKLGKKGVSVDRGGAFAR